MGGFGDAIVAEEAGGGAVSDPWLAEVQAGCPGILAQVAAPCFLGVGGILSRGPCPPVGSLRVLWGGRFVVCFCDWCVVSVGWVDLGCWR